MDDITDYFGRIIFDHVPELNENGSLNIKYVIDTISLFEAYKEYLEKKEVKGSINEDLDSFINAYESLYQLGITLKTDRRNAAENLNGLEELLLKISYEPNPESEESQRYQLNHKHRMLYSKLRESLRSNRRMDEAYRTFTLFLAISSIGFRDKILADPDLNFGSIDNALFEGLYRKRLEENIKKSLDYAREHKQNPQSITNIDTVNPGNVDYLKK